MTYVEVFFMLQILDFMTTIVGLQMGAAEMSPFVGLMMRLTDPVTALTSVKLLGFGLAGFCLWRGRVRVIHWVNYTFAAVVLWNLFNILRAVIPAV